MSYPTIEAPYGLVPVNLVGGQVYAGGVRHLPIASGYAGKLWNGDAAELVVGGTVEKVPVGAAMVTVGVFMGVMWTDEVRGLVNANYYPGGVVADDIMAVIVDDPAVVMKVAVVSDNAGTIATVGRAAVGLNMAGQPHAGDPAAHGRSLEGVLAGSEASTGTFPFRVLDVVEETKTGVDAFTEVLVMWNAGHQYNNAVGAV